MNMKKLLKRNEFYVILIIVVLSLLIQMKSGQFFTCLLYTSDAADD